MEKTVIVTGGCGYIGSHVARAFKQNGDRVFIIDRVKREHTLKDIDGHFISDFASDESLATILDLSPDVIVHCAGTSLVGPSISDPADYYNNNVAKTIKLLDFVKDFEKKPIVLFSSSASVYGSGNTSRPFKEPDPVQPISPYGNTKAMVETILANYWTAYSLPSTVFRYFNAAGAEPFNFDLGQEPGATHIIARALEASINNKAFTINGDNFNTVDGTCVRDYVHVWDIALAHVMAVNSYTDGQFGRTNFHRVYNLGTNKGISNYEIASYVDNTYGIPFVNYGEHRIGDPATLIADTDWVTRGLHWAPKYSDIGTIIDSAYKWYTRSV